MLIDPLIKAIEDRLPELAWKTSLLPHRMTLSTLPKNLFNLSIDAHPSACVNEIKQDLCRLVNLSRYSQEYDYSARRVEKKIEVLVRLCQIEAKKSRKGIENTQLMMRLCRRRQWVEELEQQLTGLKQQYHHLQTQLIDSSDTQVQLTMQADLGMLQKKITTLQEKLSQIGITSD